VQALPGKLTDAQAQQALDPVLQAILGMTNVGARLGLAQTVRTLVGRLTDEQARQLLGRDWLQRAFGWSQTSNESAAWAEAITALLPRARESDYVRLILELLKYPIAAGPATNVLLEALRVTNPTAPGAAAGLAASMRWIAESYPGIDFTSGPACPPPPPRPYLACPSRGRSENPS
jgi:hypothetical protein